MNSSEEHDSAANTTKVGQAIRLNKALARAGLCSRRAADDLILAGAVMVNGTVAASPGIRVDPAVDHVRVHGREIRLGPVQPSDHLYLVLHKPPGVVTTAHDPQGRKTVLDLLAPDIRGRRPFSVGRLDLLSEGLLLLTTDGELALRMTHPRWEHPKVYHVRVRGRVTPEKLATMLKGMRLAEGDQLAPVRARVIEDRSPRAPDNAVTLEMTLRQGVNRQIRRMCRDLRLHIVRLRRVSQGPIRLGDLPPGAIRPLTGRELKALRASLDLPLDPVLALHREPS
ncbi:pseudouridine synthase [Desulfonatronum lacustre]|uniref:pseudouridine synthase n=1 Tax=Desulfonatronum lacustre TaxID=66849 RepID=UPI0004B957C3|nr:pseudouridine synthase [Desulfonatronum lacustre]